MTFVRRRRPVAGHSAPDPDPAADSLRSHARLIGEVPRLRRYAAAWLGNAAAADRLVQDAIEQMIAQGEALDEPRPLRIRLLRLLHGLHGGDAGRLRQDGPVGLHSLNRDLPSPVAHNERARMPGLTNAIDQLSDERRQALLLIALEALSYREAADVLGLTLGTLMSRLAGAREDVLTLTGGDEVKGPARMDSATADRSGVSELDLQAYLDGELSAERVETVKAFLGSHPEQAERLARLTEREEMIRKSYEPLLHRPLPPELLAPFVTAPAQPVKPRRWPWLATTAVAAGLLLLGFVAGWLLHSYLAPAGSVVPWLAG